MILVQNKTVTTTRQWNNCTDKICLKIVDPFTAIQIKTCSKQKQTITLNRFKSLSCNLKQTKQTENDILS